MLDIKEKIIDKLSNKEVTLDIVSTPRFGWDNPKYSILEEDVRDVMTAYQNANKWLDTIKEHVLINLHLPYFSHIIHELAHTMPSRFDQFGDILHKEGLMIPYPSTEEWSKSIGDVHNTISHIFDILDNIIESLNRFRQTADLVSHSMSIDCDELINDISNEYQFFNLIDSQVEYFGQNLLGWDESVYRYWCEKDNLI